MNTATRAIEIEETDQKLSIKWNNREMKKDRFTFWFLLIFWLVWAPLTWFATKKLFSSADTTFFAIWCVFGWMGTILIPLTFLKRYSREWLEIDNSSITWGTKGFLLGGTFSRPLSEVREFGVGRYESGETTESIVTLNIVTGSKIPIYTPRHLPGYWLTSEDKEFIFSAVSSFVYKHSVPLKLTRYDDVGNG